MPIMISLQSLAKAPTGCQSTIPKERTPLRWSLYSIVARRRASCTCVRLKTRSFGINLSMRVRSNGVSLQKMQPLHIANRRSTANGSNRGTFCSFATSSRKITHTTSSIGRSKALFLFLSSLIKEGRFTTLSAD